MLVLQLFDLILDMTEGVGRNGFSAGSEIAKGRFASWDRCPTPWVCLEGDNGWESRMLTLAPVFLCVSIPTVRRLQCRWGAACWLFMAITKAISIFVDFTRLTEARTTPRHFVD